MQNGHETDHLSTSEVEESDRPVACSSRCIFSSSEFLRYLDHVGLENPPQRNFSASFISQNPDLVRSLPPIEDTLDLSDEVRAQRAVKIYRPISPGYTRLLCLKSGVWTDPLECSLTSYKLGDQTQYCALSYTWGKPVFASRVICNGIELTITKNLSDALRHMRLESTDRLLWIDALCINQADLDEKTFQIPQMYRIYENAKSTVVWLGTANERDTVMLRQVEDIADTNEESLSGRHRSICADVFVQMHNWCAKFLQRQWFTRSWIRQEVAASRDCVIMCGPTSINFAKFELGINRFLDVRADLPRTTASMPVDTTVAASRFKRLIRQRESLNSLFEEAYADAKLEQNAEQYLAGYICRRWFRLILQGSVFAATDPRDKIFSMVAALQRAAESHKGVGASPMPDIVFEYSLNYNMSISLVYQNFVKGLINTSRTLEVLSFFRPSYKLPKSALPIWVSDLREPEGGNLANGRISDVGIAELQTLSSDFSPLCARGTVLGTIGRNLDYDPRVEELVRVQLDDLDSLGVHQNEPTNTHSLAKLWQNGEPMDHILGGIGFGMFEVSVNEHARDLLGLNAGFVVVDASRDAEEGDLIVCAYGTFHPLLVRRREEWKMDDGTAVQQFCGPCVMWQQLSCPILRYDSGSVTDRVAASIGFARWKPSIIAMHERKSENEEDFNLF